MNQVNQVYPILYCGKNFVAIAVLSTKKSPSFTLESITIEPLAESSEDATVWIASLQPALQKLSQGNSLSSKKVFAIIAGRQTLVRTLNVPSIDPKRQSLATVYEAIKALPYSIADAEWQTQLVMDDSVEQIALLGAMPKQQAYLFYNIIEAQGWRLQAIFPEPVLYYNAFCYAFPHSSENALLLSINQQAAQIIFIANNAFYLRNLSLKDEKTPQQLIQFEGEINFSLEAFRQEYPDFIPKQIWVISDLHSFTTLKDSLSALFDGAIKMFNPTDFLTVTPKTSGASKPIEAPLLAAFIGVAAILNKKAPSRFPKRHPQAYKSRCYLSLNLLPKKIQAQRRFNQRKPFIMAAMILLTSASIMSAFSLDGDLKMLRAQVKQYDRTIAPLKALQQQIAPLRKTLEQNVQANQELSQMVKAKYQWSHFFQELQTPLHQVGDAWFETLSIIKTTPPNDDQSLKGNQYHNNTRRVKELPQTKQQTSMPGLALLLTGYVIDRDNPLAHASSAIEEKTNRLIQSLTTSPFIENVRDERMDTSQPGLLKFEVTIDTTLGFQTERIPYSFETKKHPLSQYAM